MRKLSIYNVSLDTFKIQYNSFVFKFFPRQETKVPEGMVREVFEMVKNRGVYIVWDHMSDDEKKIAERGALLDYLNITLRERIRNYLSEEDEYKRKGVTFERAKPFNDALRWEKEIRQLLEMEAPIEEELSFLSKKKDKVKEEKVSEVVFNTSEEVLVNSQNVIEKRRGRPRKIESFMDLNAEDVE